MTTETDTLSLNAGDDYIELYKVLKAQGMISAGGEAKHAISEGMVTVNGETETRKRKKIIVGDVVSFNGESVTVTATES